MIWEFTEQGFCYRDISSGPPPLSNSLYFRSRVWLPCPPANWRQRCRLWSKRDSSVFRFETMTNNERTFHIWPPLLSLSLPLPPAISRPLLPWQVHYNFSTLREGLVAEVEETAARECVFEPPAQSMLGASARAGRKRRMRVDDRELQLAKSGQRQGLCGRWIGGLVGCGVEGVRE